MIMVHTAFEMQYASYVFNAHTTCFSFFIYKKRGNK